MKLFYNLIINAALKNNIEKKTVKLLILMIIIWFTYFIKKDNQTILIKKIGNFLTVWKLSDNSKLFFEGNFKW